MKCSECPGLNRSYLACSHGVRHSFFIDEEIHCPIGEALRAKRLVGDDLRACLPHPRPAAPATRAW